MIKIGISGFYSKMARPLVANCNDNINIIVGFDYKNRKHNIYPIFKNPNEYSGKCDVIIDFSHRQYLPILLDYAIKTKTPLVIGTTGYNEIEELNIFNTSKLVPIFKASNMSVGVNLVADLLKSSIPILPNNYNIKITEHHHNRKIDSPSGTALMFMDILKDNLSYNPHFIYNTDKISPNDIVVNSVRSGDIIGEHEISFMSGDEIITIKHSALSRDIYARGSLNAAIFLSECKVPRLYTMQDLLNS